MSRRNQVLTCFRNLNRARKKVFEGDTHALDAARQKIKEEFVKNKSVNDPKQITELIQLANDVEKVLRATVLQARRMPSGNYQIRFTEDTQFDDNANTPPPPPSKK